MTTQLLCLTIDTDPDGLSGIETNRSALSWECLSRLESLAEVIHSSAGFTNLTVPITWFLRIDEQIRSEFGNTFYLFERFNAFWEQAISLGHELGWHPHLYTTDYTNNQKVVIANEGEACEQLQVIWEDIRQGPFLPQSFRNGEGWHTPATLSLVEEFGITFDSTAIPGRVGQTGHPMDWQGSPNGPYFPDIRDIRRAGQERNILELPMNTWLVKAPYDTQPCVRYIAPGVHEQIFNASLRTLRVPHTGDVNSVHVWVMICHPDELIPLLGDDMLHARSTESLCRNLLSFFRHIERAGGHPEFVTISEGGRRWKESAMGLK